MVDSPAQPVQLLLAGDAMLGRGVNATIRRAGPRYPLEPLIPILRSADLFFANLECAITPRKAVYSGPPKAFYFRADPPAAKTLAYAGVDLVSLANNHALDADPAGLLDTLALLAEKGIAWAGAGADPEEAARPAVVEAGGMRIGVLAFCDHQADFAAAPGQPGIFYADLRDPGTPGRLADSVAALAETVDHAVVACHWLPNWVPAIPVSYRDLAQQLVEAGARVIWGHSPHHFLGVEWIGRSAVLYSTGGLVDDYALEPVFRNDRELLFRVTLEQQGAVAVRAYPIQLDFARTRPAEGEARAWIAGRFLDMCAEVGSRVEERGEWLEVLAG